MKNTRRRKAKARTKPQIPDTPRQKETPCGQRACWSDSDEPQSKLFKYDSGRLVEFKIDGPKYFEPVLRSHKSIVSLVATADEGRMFCSGTVVDHVGGKTWILTSATLIEVFLHNKEIAIGSLEVCNLHYNIAIVSVEYLDSAVHLPVLELRDLPFNYCLHPRPVIALGRSMNSKSLMVRYGQLVRGNCELYCQELLVCLCNVSEDFIGGPIMDSEKRFLGIIYSFGETTPILPVEIAARFVKHFKKEKTLPWLRIRGQALHTLDLDLLENICCKFTRPPSGILIDKICDTSTEKFGGIQVGDIISELDGVVLYTVAQFSMMFLDKVEVARGTPNTVTLQAVVHRPTDNTTFVAKLNVEQVASYECNKTFLNRWVEELCF